MSVSVSTIYNGNDVLDSLLFYFMDIYLHHLILCACIAYFLSYNTHAHVMFHLTTLVAALQFIVYNVSSTFVCWPHPRAV